MRMIEQLARVLAKVFFNIGTGDFRTAYKEIDSALIGMTGLDYNFISRMSGKDIISLIKISEDNEMTAMKCLITGKLLKERAAAKEKEKNGNHEIAGEYEKALSLYLEGILSSRNNISLFNEYSADIEKLAAEIDLNGIPAEISFRLFKFYELTGKYDKAVNELFILKELNYIDIEKEGMRFFERLGSLSEEELNKGYFSRDEISEGLTKILK